VFRLTLENFRWTLLLVRCWKLLEMTALPGYHRSVADTIEVLERRIDGLRVAVREAVLAGDRALASAHRASLKRAEQAWEDALMTAAAPRAQAAPWEQARESAEPTGSLLPLREQVYEALSLLQVAAAPKLIATVHEAFFGATFPTARVTSLKRDEERSFRAAPFSRPYYICAALSADYLAPSRGLLAVSTWPLERRVIGSLSPRVDFLTAAIRVAEAIERIPEPPQAARRLLQRFAASIPGASSPADSYHAASSRTASSRTDSARTDGARPGTVKQAAAAELAVHSGTDDRARGEAAVRARQLAGPEQLFGTMSFREMAKETTGRVAAK
jgi:hypothetical protein